MSLSSSPFGIDQGMRLGIVNRKKNSVNVLLSCTIHTCVFCLTVMWEHTDSIGECHNIEHWGYLSQEWLLTVSPTLWTLLPEQALTKGSDASIRGIWGSELHAGFMEQLLTDGLKGAGPAILDTWHIGLLFIQNILRKEEQTLLTFFLFLYLHSLQLLHFHFLCCCFPLLALISCEWWKASLWLCLFSKL